MNLTFLFDKEPGSGVARSLLGAVGRLPESWKLNIASFYDIELPVARKHSFEYIFGNEVFSRELDAAEIEKAESMLRYPFPLLLRSYYHYRHAGPDKKKYPNFMAQLANFWDGYFERNRTDVFFSTYECNYPHSVAYRVARNRGIQIVHLAISRFGEGLVLLDNDLQPVFYKGITGEEIEKYYGEKRAQARKSVKPVKMEIEKRQGRIRVPRVPMWADYFRRRGKETNFYGYTRPGFYQLSMSYLTRNVRGLVVPMLYQKADFDRKFFLYPLSQFKEATNSLHYNMFDQYDIVKLISRALPSGHMVYVKPHPHFNGNNVVIGKIRELRKLKNVRFIPANTSSKQLIDKCSGVITLGATTGLEGIILGKPVIAFGDPFYAQPGTALTVRDLSELPEMLMNVIRDPSYGVDEEKRKEMIAKYCKHHIRISGRPATLPDLELDEEDTAKVADGIVECCEYIVGSRRGPKPRRKS